MATQLSPFHMIGMNELSFPSNQKHKDINFSVKQECLSVEGPPTACW